MVVGATKWESKYQVPEVLSPKYVEISCVLVIHLKLLALLAINVEK